MLCAMQELTLLMISCRSYCCVRYGQWLYMVWFMDLSLHLHRQPPPPARASAISHCISFPPVGEITGQGINPCGCWDLHTLVEPRQKILGLWFPNVETFCCCPRPPCFEAAAPEKGGRALPSLCESHSFSTCLTPVPLACYRITSLGQFHDNRHRDFNAERKVWRIWALMR